MGELCQLKPLQVLHDNGSVTNFNNRKFAGFSSREQMPIRDGMPEQMSDPIEWQLEKDAKFLQKLGVVDWEIQVTKKCLRDNIISHSTPWLFS